MPKKPAQIELPFILEGNLSPRPTVRSISKIAEGHYKIDLAQIRIRPQFNARRKPEGMTEELWEHALMIPQLADAIFSSNGPAEPILGDFYKGDDNFYITNGERRFRALNHLLRTKRKEYPNGKPVNEVLILLNPTGTTDLDRKRKVIATQDNMKLKPMERAYYYLSFKNEDGMTHEQIANFLGVARQTVDNYVLATTLPAEIQAKIDADEIKMSTALSDHREQKKVAKGKNDANWDEEDEMTPFGSKVQKKHTEGDEDEFKQADNSVAGVSSMGGTKESSSGAHVVGKDSIYMNEQKTALWKQMLNRLGVVREDVANNLPTNNAMGETLSADELTAWADKEVVIRMMNEYNLTVK